jgi:hypothetical protein
MTTSTTGEPLDGSCGAACACPSVEPVPVACSLDAGGLQRRLGDWDTALAAVRARTPIDGGLRLELSADADLGPLVALIVAEQRCCPFFAFALTVDHRGTALEVRAPEEAADLVAAVFGAR